MSSDRPSDDRETLLPALEDVELPGQGRASQAIARLGRKAVTLGRLQRERLPVPPTWTLAASVFADFCRTSLPRGHDLRTLIKLSGSAEGQERAARAYARLLGAPLPAALTEGLERFWREQGDGLPRGVAVRASLVLPSARAAVEPPAPSSVVGVSGAAAIGDGLRRLWAQALLSSAVAEYAAAGLKEIGVAALLQKAVDATWRLLLTPLDDGSASAGQDESAAPPWQLAALPSAGVELPWCRLPSVLYPVRRVRRAVDAQGRARPAAADPVDTADVPDRLVELAAALGPAGLDEICALADAVASKVDYPVALELACRPPGTGDQSERLRLLSVRRHPAGDHRPRQRRTGTLVEVGLGARGREPASHLGASILGQLAQSSLTAAAEQLRCKPDTARLLTRTTDDRSYLELRCWAETVAAAPLQSVEGLLLATGGRPSDALADLARRIDDGRSHRLRKPLVAAGGLLSQLRIERETVQTLRRLDREHRTISEIDLTLLPNDGITTTLVTAQQLVEQVVTLWARWLAAQLVVQLVIAAMVHRRVPEAPLTVGMVLTAGAGEVHGARLANSLQPVITALEADEAARQRLRRGDVRTVQQLPDGRFRGALGYFLTGYGDVGLGVLDVGRPRWQEDASDLLQMILAARGASEPSPASAATARSRTVAASELARYEPFLSPLERRGLRIALDRCKSLARQRRDVDRWVLRSLATLRQVLLDVDRRLRRIDPSIAEGGAFRCQPKRLLRALAGGRPELGDLIEMRQAERALFGRLVLPPTGTEQAPVEASPLAAPPAQLDGIGVSPGVVEGRVRRLTTPLPKRLADGDVLVGAHADFALSPLWLRAAAVVSETGGAASPAAEILRELGIPAVMSVPHAVAHLADGERVRIDGTGGRVERLDAEAPASRRAGTTATP